jgi:selenocysteine lyase/cysteine desulfurase
MSDQVQEIMEAKIEERSFFKPLFSAEDRARKHVAAPVPSESEDIFDDLRENTIGTNQTFVSPHGEKRIVYADWTASGRLYGPLEEKLSKTFGPFVGNTHSESSVTGTAMTAAYAEARRIIKRHVNASGNDVLIACGSGMTDAVNKLQRLLGLRAPERFQKRIKISKADRPIVFVTHMEHHSNQTSWLETIADVEVIPPNKNGEVDLNALGSLLGRYSDRRLKIGSLTACSNVTGVKTPYATVAKMMHKAGGLCFVDFSASAPYVNIDMHPIDPDECLDAIYFSPHKFLGGPGSAGVLLLNGKLIKNSIPDSIGGGIIAWSNPWGEHSFISDIESREDAGTPGFLQLIRVALCIKLKEKVGVEAISIKERQIVSSVFCALEHIKGVNILAKELRDRLPIFSFYIDNVHYNLVIRLLNDRYGIQARGGCSCAGTYGHFLLNVDKIASRNITSRIDNCDLSEKPGWVRISFHPTTAQEDIDFCLRAIEEIAEHARLWEKDYEYDPKTNEYTAKRGSAESWPPVSWFEF